MLSSHGHLITQKTIEWGKGNKNEIVANKREKGERKRGEKIALASKRVLTMQNPLMT